MQHTMINLLVLMVVFCAGTQARAEYDKWNGVAFSAERSIYRIDQPGSIEKSKVYYSKLGTRVETTNGTSKAVSIVNYQRQKCWLVLPHRKAYYEVALDHRTKQCRRLGIPEFRPETRNPGIFFPRPCYGYKNMKVIGKDRVVGRRASKLRCIDNDDGSNSLQWYDPILRMVIREVRDNKVIQAGNIQLARQAEPQRLVPPADFSKLSIGSLPVKMK